MVVGLGEYNSIMIHLFQAGVTPDFANNLEDFETLKGKFLVGSALIKKNEAFYLAEYWIY